VVVFADCFICAGFIVAADGLYQFTRLAAVLFVSDDFCEAVENLWGSDRFLTHGGRG